MLSSAGSALMAIINISLASADNQAGNEEEYAITLFSRLWAFITFTHVIIKRTI